MTQDEIKKALLHEARVLGHAEARTKSKEKAARDLVKEGKLVRGGGSTGGWSWYKLAEKPEPRVKIDPATQAWPGGPVVRWSK